MMKVNNKFNTFAEIIILKVEHAHMFVPTLGLAAAALQ